MVDSLIIVIKDLLYYSNIPSIFFDVIEDLFDCLAEVWALLSFLSLVIVESKYIF
jgi:hypothetical protein